MKTEVNYLIKKYGSLRATAEKLGIKERQLQNLRNGKRVGKSLKKLVDIYVRLIEIVDE